MGAKAFGEQNPTQGETAVSWQTWSDGLGSVPTIDGDADWGKLKLDTSGGEGRSAVYDLGSEITRKFTLTENRYGTGTSDVTLQYRTSTSSFNQDDVSPDWTTYTIPFSKNCRYVQKRETTIVKPLAMWVWASDLKTKANIDTMISFSTGTMTDIFIFAIDDSVTPRTWLGTGTLGDSNPTVIEGTTPLG